MDNGRRLVSVLSVGDWQERNLVNRLASRHQQGQQNLSITAGGWSKAMGSLSSHKQECR